MGETLPTPHFRHLFMGSKVIKVDSFGSRPAFKVTDF